MSYFPISDTAAVFAECATDEASLGSVSVGHLMQPTRNRGSKMGHAALRSAPGNAEISLLRGSGGHVLVGPDSAPSILDVRRAGSRDLCTVHVLGNRRTAEKLATALDDVPVYLVQHATQAHAIVESWIADKFATLDLALNGEDIAYSHAYGSAAPS